MADSTNSGIFVLESPSRGEPVPVDEETVCAFVGPTPRGPIDRPVPVAGMEDFRKYFGIAGTACRLEGLLRQYFINGGRIAFVVRVSGTDTCNRISLPMQDGVLELNALNPGPLEFIRASVDYDGIGADSDRFNLVIQRLRQPDTALIDEQEIFRDVSTDPGANDYLGDALVQSALVRLHRTPAGGRPLATVSAGVAARVSWVNSEVTARRGTVPSDYDLIGSRSTGTGLFALDHADGIGIVCLLSGAAGLDLGPVAELAAMEYCRQRQALLLLDPPLTWQSPADVQHARHAASLTSVDVATYYPRLSAKGANGTSTVSALGAIAGVLVARDRRVGATATGPATLTIARDGGRPAQELCDEDVRHLARLGVNSIVGNNALQLRLKGDVTTGRMNTADAASAQLHIHRAVLCVLRSVRRATEWIAFHENGPDLWSEVAEQIDDYLATLFDSGGLAGNSYRDAFCVRCDAETNAGLAGSLGAIDFIIAFALQTPGEFRAYRIARRNSRCEIHEIGWQPAMALAG